jgi:hypothetical protein
MAVSVSAQPAVAQHPAVERPRRPLDIASEIAISTDELQIELARPNRRRRYSLLVAALLVVGVGGSLLLLTRNTGATGNGEAAATPVQHSSSPSAAARPVPSTVHEVVAAGAVQQGDMPSTRGEARTTTAAAAPASRAASRAPSHKVDAPVQAPEPAPVLASAPPPNVNVAVSASADLRLVPPEMLVDARTRLTSGEDLVEQGDYQMAHRSFRVALTQLDSIDARFPTAEAVRVLRRQLDQADAKAVQACGAENEMRKRRGETPRGCQ